MNQVESQYLRLILVAPYKEYVIYTKNIIQWSLYFFPFFFLFIQSTIS